LLCLEKCSIKLLSFKFHSNKKPSVKLDKWYETLTSLLCDFFHSFVIFISFCAWCSTLCKATALPYSTRKWIKDDKLEKRKKINEKSCDLVNLSIYVDWLTFVKTRDLRTSIDSFFFLTLSIWKRKMKMLILMKKKWYENLSVLGQSLRKLLWHLRWRICFKGVEQVFWDLTWGMWD